MDSWFQASGGKGGYGNLQAAIRAIDGDGLLRQIQFVLAIFQVTVKCSTLSPSYVRSNAYTSFSSAQALIYAYTHSYKRTVPFEHLQETEPTYHHEILRRHRRRLVFDGNVSSH
uniref:Uncharacterized protein n=1 Tax=Aegilops tauschii TaxID=37682 RepID=M8BUG0_AEGTA